MDILCRIFAYCCLLVTLVEAQTTLSLINNTTQNGSFELGASETEINDWTIGFGGEETQRKQNNASDGEWSLVIGKGSGNELGAALNTGHAAAQGDVYNLSFDWLPMFNWTTSDEIAWRLFTTSDDTINGEVHLIAEGQVSGYSGGTYQTANFDQRTGVGSVHDGREVWLQLIRGSASLSHFARVDNVQLSVVTDPQPTFHELAGAALVAYYPGENDSLDYSAIEPMEDGNWLASETYAPGHIDDACFEFNGLDAALEIPNNLVDNFTLSFWMKTTATAASGSQWVDGMGLVDGSADGIHNDVGVALVGSKLAFGCGDDDTTIFSSTVVNDGAWKHVVVQRHSTSGHLYLYIDGELEAEIEGPHGARNASSVLRIGGLLSGGGYFNGSLDDIRIFDQVLSADSVMRLYESSGDLDLDGLSDHAELVAASDWLDARSGFRPVSILGNSDTQRFQVSLSGRATRQYALYRKANLSSGDWSETGVNASLNYDRDLVLEDTEEIGAQSFYRVEVRGRGPSVEKQPNILVIIVDDMGWNDLSANPDRDPSYYSYGPDEVYTPNMDRIAAQGVVFTNGYVSGPVCSPSRAGWMTGLHQNRWDHGGGWRPGLSDQTTIAERLRDAGYATGRVGKNDYGVTLTSPDNFGVRSYPGNHGYDFFLGFSAHAHDFWFHETGGVNVDNSSAHAGPFQYHDDLATPMIVEQRKAYSGSDDPNNLDNDSESYYITDLLTDEAIGFIDRASTGDQPFFLTVSYNSVHHLSPQVPEKYLASEAARLGWATSPAEAEHYDPGTDTTTNPSDYSDFYGYWNQVGNIGASDMRKYYLANLRCLDDNIGRVLNAIEAAGMTEDTLIFFLSDNGGPPETGANNGPLAGSKYNLFEGGIRVPFMVSWPAKLPQGEVYDYLVSSLDIVPTCLEVAQAQRTTELDGISLMAPLMDNRPTLPSQDDPSIDERTLFWRWQTNNWAVRRGDWKLVKSGKNRSGTFTDEVYFDNAIVGKKSLFDLNSSPKEILANDRIDTETATAAELEQLYQAWVSSL